MDTDSRFLRFRSTVGLGWTSVVSAMVLGLLLALVLAATISRPPSDSSVGSSFRADASSTGNDSTSPSWLAVGSAITQSRSNAPAPPAGSFQSVDPSAANYLPKLGPYLTEPLDITANGTVDLLAGPLSAADTASPHVSGVSFPSDITYSPQPNFAGISLINKSGQFYLEIPVSISNLASPYQGLQAWVQ
jgi:hypothetical protein